MCEKNMNIEKKGSKKRFKISLAKKPKKKNDKQFFFCLVWLPVSTLCTHKIDYQRGKKINQSINQPNQKEEFFSLYTTPTHIHELILAAA